MQNLSSSRYLVRSLDDKALSSENLKALLGDVARVDSKAEAPEGSFVVILNDATDDAREGWHRLDKQLNDEPRERDGVQAFAVLPVLQGRFGGESYADGTIVVELRANKRTSQLNAVLSLQGLNRLEAAEESRRYLVALKERGSKYLPDVLDQLRTHDELFSRVYLNADLVANRAAR